jgi:hypothetical protein
MPVLVVIARENFDSSHFELFNSFPGDAMEMTIKTSIPRGHQALLRH